MLHAFEIGGRLVGEGAPTFIVAELSANHGGKLDVALRTIEEAKKAGADAIKIQTYTPDTLTLKSDVPPFVVRTNNEWAGRTLHDLYAEAMTPWAWHAQLRDAAHAAGLVFFSTPFDPTAAEFLEQLDVPAHKIASFELVDLPLVENVARRGKPIIMSTGMASLEDIEAALAVCRDVGNERVVLLRCVSAYPAEPDDMNLRSLTKLQSLCPIVGLSDHTRDATVAIAAVALGARLVEKHFILDRAVGGPDASFSLVPDEFSSMVRSIRQTERALGPPRFGPSEAERASTAFRRSLFFAKTVDEGAIITCDDVRSVRPSDGLHPRHLPAVLGRIATRRSLAGAPVTWEAARPADTVTIELRRAREDDAQSLLEWRNDAMSRQMSVQHAEVTKDEHARWLARTLPSEDTALFVGVMGGEKIGQIRLDRWTNGTWAVSVTVAPAVRSKGLARVMLVSAEQRARELGAVRLVARIRPENERSVRAFKAVGYYAFVERDSPEGRFLHCERRIVPFA